MEEKYCFKDDEPETWIMRLIALRFSKLLLSKARFRHLCVPSPTVGGCYVRFYTVPAFLCQSFLVRAMCSVKLHLPCRNSWKVMKAPYLVAVQSKLTFKESEAVQKAESLLFVLLVSCLLGSVLILKIFV